MFQFHSGSIQTSAGLLDASLMPGFNSTLVRFKLPKPRSVIAPVENVSIPLWFDSNLLNGNSTCPRLEVSIPLWFDSNHPALAKLRDGSLSFNSTLVRFKREQYQWAAAQVNCFNSTLVRFKRDNL